ncbi:hypothetical protein CAPTEDRAFT_188935 [Capitella teleta]|uniref:DNA 3'-5' helicase n=1 Tax=Capitella teleta TaxID=283909 RepID=R7UC31_CAPTE|nr:hypothetical protein CAPTEDRAFT_188935 [Capitella teleta]|eukprot:ELU00827.1 hypothetical protein CAPTEDRAFT_188935 [Capitella teleta]
MSTKLPWKEWISAYAKRLCLLTFDEAHVVPQWGKDFRHVYLEVGMLRSVLRGNACTLALTATLNLELKEKLLDVLHLEDSETVCVVRNPDRPNITLQIWPRRESQRGKVPLPLQQYVEHFKEKTLSGHFNEIEKSILYCRELNDVGRFFVLLRKLLGAAAVDAEDPDDRTICVYYAGIDLPSERLALARFAEGKAKLMITTVAFGLGINIPDVRRVHHYGAPATVLEYWQEIGRFPIAYSGAYPRL